MTHLWSWLISHLTLHTFVYKIIKPSSALPQNVFFSFPQAPIFSMQNEQCFLDWFSIPFIHSSVPFLFIHSSSFVAHQIDGMPTAVFSEYKRVCGFCGLLCSFCTVVSDASVFLHDIPFTSRTKVSELSTRG